jgi:restriction system protein
VVAGSSRGLDWILSGGTLAFVVLLGFVSNSTMELTESLKWLLGGLLLIGSIVAVALVAWHLWSRPTTPTARELSLRFEAVRSMSGAQFEVFTADVFRAMGHQAVVLGGAGDQGVDVIVNRRGERVAVQCKNHKRPVGNRPVQEVYAGAQHHRCVESCVVAPAGYTSIQEELSPWRGVRASRSTMPTPYASGYEKWTRSRKSVRASQRSVTKICLSTGR